MMLQNITAIAIICYIFHIADLSEYSGSPDEVESSCPQILVPNHDSFGPVEPPTQPPGPSGPRGFRGERGPTGEQGVAGADGTDGVDGMDGEDGATGEQGNAGDTGAPGRDGELGEQGLVGLRGPQGVQGDSGERGPIGLTGLRGPTGKVIYTKDGQEFSGAALEEQETFLDSEWWHLIFVIWLAVFTLVLIITIIVMCCWIKKHKKDHNLEPDVETAVITTKYPSTTDTIDNEVFPVEAAECDDGVTTWNAMKEGSEMGASTITINDQDNGSHVTSTDSLKSGNAVVVGRNSKVYSSTDALNDVDLNY